mmetsp:Transcript_18197/g.39670  ORF Transcript_18197/g.39670 Transcript_18197/m.39670 type:complete len:415 (+) Transcript_18197:362-1606(+)|eukprot:CAMPEP_0168194380 /NCGR_PEP_ID=MMETSP0139_2-20121125/19157_1 /TAXON_ID=44445 /ORGANISM="Pseudo-nitzschia australis, Strain 10249 10 AB" /LENGTH=414 /DNA_ID=CAMNT_0008117895 /DNA_START=343 /DNA_END=1587 /DNA_ORIENTATION=+
MSFDLSSDGSSDGSSVVDLSTLLSGGNKNNENNNRDEKKNIASTVGDEPSRRNNSNGEDKSSNAIHFEFGEDSSSEGSSVVDVSTLLPRNSNQRNGSDEKKGILSILGDVPSQLNINSSEKIDNERENIGDDQNNGRNESKQIGAKNNPSTDQQSSKKSSEKTKDYEESKSDCKSHMMRIVMGESVKAWRTERNTTKKSKKATNQNNTIRDTDTKPHGKHPQFVLVQKRDSLSDPKSSKNYLVSPTKFFENSHLNVHRSSGGNGDRIEIVIGPSKRHSAEGTDDEKNQRTIKYGAKQIKRQLSNHQNQTPLSLSTRLATSTFVDCIAIWDPVRKVYVLEVPELVVHDVATTMAASGNNDGDDENDNAATALRNNPRSNRIHGSRHDPATRRPDPIEQQRQAEMKLQSHRKRRRS